MKSVMISIQSKWCQLIACGQKTLEIRRTRPKLETPFKVYIYCTKGVPLIFADADGRIPDRHVNGKVIGEFICDSIRRFDVPYPAFQDKLDPQILKESCHTYYALHRYAYHDALFGWHISDLKIYEKPKELCSFHIPCREYQRDNPRCGYCDFYKSMGEYPAECACDGAKPVVRPPQSWCYVEDIT